VTWNERYDLRPELRERYQFVELDYRDRRTVPSEEPHRHYGTVDSHMPDDVRGLLEVMLYYGSGSGQQNSAKEEESDESADTSRSTFTAPYEHLSPWTCFLGFKSLQRIYQYLSSSALVRWKALVSASSRYRSSIPLHTGQDRPTPVISSYYALFLELKFLYHFYPRLELAIMLAEVHTHASFQLSQYGALSQPMYRAYSSLRHGFRRLTDPLTPEFRELKDYLMNSNHRIHGLRFELHEIYSVFIKANLPNPYRDWVNISAEFASLGAAGDEERLLLWQGTPLDSLLGILDLGLQIRRKGASWTGTMFGNGIYFADAASKSATFCKHRVWNGEAVLLLCEVDVGKQRIRSQGAMQGGHEVIGASFWHSRCIEGLGKVGPARWKEVGWEMGGEPGATKGVVRMVSTWIPSC